jgi:hypothetical protein
MTAALVPVATPALDRLAPAADRAEAYARNAKAPATRRAYASDWRCFDAWCTAAGLPCLPAAPETVALYIAALAEPGNDFPPHGSHRSGPPRARPRIASISSARGSRVGMGWH